jgi:asparagine synthase (glutamine-hydrolysing)
MRLKNTRHAQFFNAALADSFYSNIFSIEQNMFPMWELSSLNLSSKKSFPNDVSFLNSLSPADAQAFFDLTHYLKDDLLVKVDRASMLTSLEVRPPLLDHRLIEEVLQLPLIHKIKSGESKYLLKEILADYIPRELFDRPKKGFSIPMQRWLKKELGFLPERYLQNQNLRVFEIRSFDAVQDILEKYRSGSHSWYYNRIWVLVVLSQYLENHPEIEIGQ